MLDFFLTFFFASLFFLKTRFLDTISRMKLSTQRILFCTQTSTLHNTLMLDVHMEKRGISVFLNRKRHHVKQSVAEMIFKAL